MSHSEKIHFLLRSEDLEIVDSAISLVESLCFDEEDLCELLRIDLPTNISATYELFSRYKHKHYIQIWLICFLAELEIEWAEELEELNLANQSLSKIPYNIFNLTKLKKLDCSKNQIIELPDFSELSELEELILSENGLKEWPLGLEDIQTLKKIDLSENLIRDLSETSFFAPTLKHLSLKGNPLNTAPDFISQLCDLETLKIGASYIQKLPDLSGLTNLNMLDAAGARLNTWPQDLSKNKKLETCLV